MNHELHTTIDIDATPEVVWEILTDLDQWTDWNPFITSSAGRPEVGEKLVNRKMPPGGTAITFTPRVTVIEDGKTFEWLGRLVLPGVFDGRHRFELVATPTGGTRLVHSEDLNGVLVRFLRKSLDTQTLQGFELMNAALKTRAEAVMAVAS
jgi:hypothetical protein